MKHKTVPCPSCGHSVRRLDPEWARAKRKAAGLTVTALAARMGVTLAYLSDMETGRRPFTADQEANFLRALSLPS